MRRLWRILIGMVVTVVIGSFAFGWHLSTVYNSFVASTSIGDPLFEPAVLTHYGNQLEDYLTENNVKVAIVSRAGQPRDKLPEGIRYTHSAFWVSRQALNPESATGYDVYNLYHGEENRLVSSLVTDTPADFLRLLREKDAGMIIPSQEMQAIMLEYIQSPDYGTMHQKNYSLISNPYDTRFQNCNEFMLYTLASIHWNTTSSVTISERLQERGYSHPIKASLLRRYIGPMVDERLIMDDHGSDIRTTTSQTLADFMQKEGQLLGYSGAQQVDLSFVD